MSKAKKDALKRTTDPVKRPDGKEKNRDIIGRIKQWFADMRGELKKVMWPTRKQVANNTMVALVVMGIAAVMLWGFDTVADTGVKALIQLVR